MLAEVQFDTHDEGLNEELALLSEVWGSCEQYNELAHKELLETLWSAAFSGPFERTSSRWESLGFQGADPSNDLRGVGATGLAHLLDFCKSGTGAEAVRRVTRGESSFPLAAASLNVTHTLCAHLHVLRTFGAGSAGATPRAGLYTLCSTNTLRNAVRLQLACGLESTSLLSLIHSQLLRRLFDQWEGRFGTAASLQGGSRADQGSTKGAALMAFPPMLAEGAEHMRATLARAKGPWDMRKLLIELRGGESACVDGRAESASAWSGVASSRRLVGLSARSAGLGSSCPPSLMGMVAGMVASLLVAFGAPPTSRA